MPIDLTAPIKPGTSAAGIALGERTAALPRPLRKAPLSGLELFEYSCVSVWVQHGFVHQVGVCEGYSGTLAEGIGVGSSIADVERLIGKVEEDEEDNLIVVGYPGWCFETEEWLGHRIKDNGPARITSICIYKPSK
jgi:hypothetical protein